MSVWKCGNPVNINNFFSDKQEIQEELRWSLRDKFRNFMSNDWLPEDAEGHKPISTQGFYIKPNWTRTVEEGLKDEHVPMKRLYEIFEIYKDKSRIIAEGGA